ncbi:hypothetical protein BpHYR1_012678 [Brachionus plicatilis]|uniref:Uncharacterized protein n=1 Tax=Brachionus plicatilis TaxID=10195 RepID=A0A3M7Q5K3_BRAPC|nr:hypothetical protein BpHYR1_012678 [Brachionus plicatilis]
MHFHECSNEDFEPFGRLIDKSKCERVCRFHDLEWHPNAKDVILGAHKKKTDLEKRDNLVL